MNRFLSPKRLLMAGVVTGSLAAGAVLGATTFNLANAATSTPSASGSASTGAGSTAPPNMPPHGSQAHESAETPVTGPNATKAQAAAVKSVGSGTAGAVTTDFTKNGYEVTVTKSTATRWRCTSTGPSTCSRALAAVLATAPAAPAAPAARPPTADSRHHPACG